MYKVIKSISFFLFLVSCAPQSKTVELANGEKITQKQYQKKLNKSFRIAEKDARKVVKGKMTKKDVDEFYRKTTVVIDTLN